MPEFTKEEMEKMRKSAEDKMRTVDFQVDTVSVDEAAGAAAYYRSSNNTITSNYEIEDDDYGHKYNQSHETLIHEQKHRDNYLQGFYAYAVSPEQAYKRNMHDEISATMAELISLREEYIETGDINVFDRIPKLSFYKKAIEKGEINPRSQYKEDFDKDMRFIVNGTQKMWVDAYGRDFYIDNCLWKYANRSDHEGKYAAYWDQNYQNSLKIAYNIGGVDFTKYMEKDVEIPEEANAKMIEKIANNPSMQKYYHLTDAQVLEKSGLPPYDGSISLCEYKQLLQHQMAINSKFSDIYNPEGQKYTTQGYMKYLISEEHKKVYEEFCSDDMDFRKKYPDFAAFQYSQCKYERDQLNNAIQDIDEAFIDKIVEYQAREYAKTGKDFPRDNPENYRKALKKLYCGAYDILKPDETKLKSELSKSAEKLQNKSSWERTMENYLKAVGVSPEDAEFKAHDLAQKNKIIGGYGCFVGGPFYGAYNKAKDLKHRMTHTIDEDGKEKYVGLWRKIKHKAKDLKEDVKRWFKKTEPVKNEAIHPVNKNAPEYPKWSKDNRVSEVQHRKILDLRKPIIKQPIQSKADNQQNNANSKGSTALKMKKDTVKAQVAAKQPKNGVNLSKDKTVLKNIMKQDTTRAKEVFKNVGKQKAMTKKVAKIIPAVHNEKQILKDLYHKVLDR